MMLTATDYIAALGALTGCLALLFDAIKWFRDGPKLKIRVRPDTCYEDGEVVNVEKTEHGECKTYATYYHIEVVNVGTLPTTLLGIEITSKPLGVEKIKKELCLVKFNEKALTPHFGKNLPQVLNSGEVWSCRVNKNKIISISQTGKPKIALSVAHLDSPIYEKIKPIKP